MAKGEIARFEQFHLWSLCFQKSSAAEASESIHMWERVNWYFSLNTYCITQAKSFLVVVQKNRLSDMILEYQQHRDCCQTRILNHVSRFIFRAMGHSSSPYYLDLTFPTDGVNWRTYTLARIDRLPPLI